MAIQTDITLATGQNSPEGYMRYVGHRLNVEDWAHPSLVVYADAWHSKADHDAGNEAIERRAYAIVDTPAATRLATQEDVDNGDAMAVDDPIEVTPADLAFTNLAQSTVDGTFWDVVGAAGYPLIISKDADAAAGVQV